MKIIVIYESKFGNGKKLSEELVEILKGKGQESEAFSINNVKPKNLPAADIYVFSSPTRVFMLPIRMKLFIKRFIPKKAKAKYALMTTYMDPRVKALKAMDKLMRSKKMGKASNDFKVKVLDLKGPLEEGYRKGLEQFADNILSGS